MNINRVAIVTGGTRGMGKAISLSLAREGITVFAVYNSDHGAAEETLSMLQDISPQCNIVKGNVADCEQVTRIVDTVVQQTGRVDILINNAGIFDFCFIQDMTEEYFDNILSVNLKSQFFMLKACLPYLKKSDDGRVVNASSISGSLADVGLLGYGASKAGVNMLTKIAAAELAPYNVTVNAYAPGMIHTDMTNDLILERGDEQSKQIALNRFGKVEDVSSLVDFLVSPGAAYITGEIIGIDGGFFKVQNPYRAHKYADNETEI